MPGLNPLVARSRGMNPLPAQPTDSLRAAHLANQRAAAAAQPGFVMTPGSSTPGSGGGGGWDTNVPADIEKILRTIRGRESGSPEGNYTAKTGGWHPTRRTASGAYQFTKGTWNNYGGYQHAFQAPKHVQDARAIQDVKQFLAMGRGVEAVPGMWFRPATYMNRGQWDIPIKGNNGLTMRSYIQKWMDDYRRFGG